MALPKLLQQTFYIELPSNKKKIEFRPFIEKEREILLMALESSEDSDIMDCIKKLINACCMDETFNVDDVPIFDIEYCFLQIRAKSIGEIINPKFKCENVVGETVCGNTITVDVDLTKSVINFGTVNKNIELSPKMHIVMKYPTFGQINDLTKYDNESREYVHRLAAKCIDMFILDENSIFRNDEYKEDEWVEFIKSLTIPQIKKIEDFLTQIPVVNYNIDAVCKKCNFHHSFNIEGYESFFV